MFEIYACPIDAKLSKGLDNATLLIAQLEKNQSLCPIEASKRLVAAQTAWIKHQDYLSILLRSAVGPDPLVPRTPVRSLCHLGHCVSVTLTTRDSKSSVVFIESEASALTFQSK